MKALRCIVLILVVIGALNWGLWGFFQFDLVAYLFGGASSGLARLIYSIVGLAGLYALSFFGGCKCSCGKCSKDKKSCH